MLVAHTGDLHVTQGPRLADTLACLDFIASDAAAAGVDLVVIGGDLAGHRVPYHSNDTERCALEDFFQRLAQTAPVVIVEGNHDLTSDIEVYRRLKGPHPIYVLDRPTELLVAGAQLFGLPYPKEQWLAPRDGTMDEQRLGAIAQLQALLASWRERPRAPGVPRILAGHLTVVGAIAGGGEIMGQNEIALTRADLLGAEMDAIFLSHIHKAQDFYAGSPACHGWGEQIDRKSYALVEVCAGVPAKVTRRFTPARQFLTVTAEWAEREGVWGWQREAWPLVDPGEDPASAIAGTEVRLQLTFPEDARASVPMAEYEARLRAAGARAVKVEPVPIPKTRIRSEAIVTARTTAEKCAAYWSTLGAAGPTAAQRARALAKLAELQTPAPLVAEEAAA